MAVAWRRTCDHHDRGWEIVFWSEDAVDLTWMRFQMILMNTFGAGI